MFSKRIFRKKTTDLHQSLKENLLQKEILQQQLLDTQWEIQETKDSFNLTSKHFHGLGHPPQEEKTDRPKTS